MLLYSCRRALLAFEFLIVELLIPRMSRHWAYTHLPLCVAGFLTAFPNVVECLDLAPVAFTALGRLGRSETHKHGLTLTHSTYT